MSGPIWGGLMDWLFSPFPSDQNNTTLQAIKIQMSHTQMLILLLFGLLVTVKANKTSRWSLHGSFTFFKKKCLS